MNLDSIIDKLLHDLSSGLSHKIEVVDQSTAYHLLDNDSKEASGDKSLHLTSSYLFENEPEYVKFRSAKFKPVVFACVVIKWLWNERPRLKHFYEHSNLPFISWFFYLLWWIFRIVVWFFYKIANGIWLLCTRKRRERGLEYSKLFNAVISLAVIITLIVILVSCFLFFLKGILFLSPSNNINTEGTVVMEQPCGKEHYLYVYNTAKSWANTGIEILKGDKVKICTSGSYYSNIADLDEAAENNKIPKYLFKDSTQKREDKFASSLTVYHVARSNKNIDKPRFGYLIFAVQHDNEWDYDSPNYQKMIFQAERFGNSTFKREFVAEKSGQLFVSINDIYLSRHVIDTLLKDSSLFNMVIHTEDTSCTSDYNPRESLVNLAQQRPEAWFDDNVGELLINVTIIRNKFHEGNYLGNLCARLYRNTESCFFLYFVFGIFLVVVFDIINYKIYSYINSKE